MHAIVVVAGEVDERDIWPYATWSDSDGTHTTLTAKVHDSQELVGVLAALTALGLQIESTLLIEQPLGRQDPVEPEE